MVIFTLTVRNCEITEVKNTIQNMHKAFIKMIQRKHFKTYNLGFIKTTEITRSKTGKAHPHFHVLLFMKSEYFNRGYLSNKAWGELWQDCLGVDYTPSVKLNPSGTRRRVKWSRWVKTAWNMLLQRL